MPAKSPSPAPAKTTLPTKQIAGLLDEMGLQETWKTLIATHAKLSYDSEPSKILLADSDYTNARILNEDLLAGRTLGQVSILYEFSLAHVDKDSRRQSGQYFTPDDVANFMAKQTKLFPEGIWLDPCSGVGNLAYALAKIQPDPEQFIKNRLYLVDKDDTALLIARALFFLHFYHGDKKLLQALKNRFLKRDFLSPATPLPKYDYALLNPPYAQTQADNRFKTAKARDMFAYFLEQVSNNAQGFVSITPQSFTHGNKFDSLRKLLLSDFSSLRIYCFDNVPDSIFHGIKFGSTNTNMANSVRACIMVARKTDREHLITPLLRWNASQRAKMFEQVDTKLGSVPMSEKIFPKNFCELGTLYSMVREPQYTTLSKILSPTPTSWSLVIPSTPRYFLPAVERSLSRTSFHTIFFHSEIEREDYYVFLNSSLPYWWWRVCDGGMSLSLGTLYDTPVPIVPKKSPALANRLLISEQNNLVVKKNAGKDIENIKHDSSLIEDINIFYFGPDLAKELMVLHKNTYFE